MRRVKKINCSSYNDVFFNDIIFNDERACSE